MATGTKKSTTKKSTGRRRESAKAREARLRAQRQMRAIILMAVGLLFCALVFLPGEGIWNTAHKAMFGLLGIVAWGAALIPVYLAAVLSSDSRYTRFKVQAILLTLLAVLIAAAVQAGGGTVPESEKFTEMVAELYAQGAAMKGGGLIGSLLGVPLVNACGKVGALVILGLGIFICLMFLTGSTLVGLYSGMVEKPARKVSEAYSGAVDTLSQRMAEAEPRRPKFNIDVPMPTKPPVDPLAEEEDEEEPEPEQSGARNALTEAARRFFSPDTAAPQPARREVSATAEAFGDGSREEPAEEAIPAEPEVPEAAEAAEAEVPAPEPQAVEPEPGEKELEVPAEPDHEYIDEIIRRMAQKQAAAREKAEAARPAAAAVVPQPAAEPAAPQESLEPAAPAAVQPERSYVFPSITLLNEPQPRNTALDGEQLKQNAQRLVDTLQSFGVQTRIIDISRGPAVTRYELQPSAGVKISKITNLADDIAEA